MRDAPSAELVELLAHLGLATPEQVRSVRRYALSLAKHTALFDSVWVDALMRRRLLTPFQAAEINAGRGAALAVGPHVLCQAPERLGYADQHLANDRTSGEQVRVVVARLTASQANQNVLAQLRSQAEQLQSARQAETALGVQPYLQSGVDEQRLWVVQPYQVDITVRELLLRGGRLSGELVLEIARQLVAELAALERFSLIHGDISASTVRVHESGQVQLMNFGLRSVLRPGEGYAHADLPAEAYDYLAPERITAGTCASVSSDLYACGCLCWQLLTGRAPLAGGDSLAKIKSAHAARIVPVSRLAPEAPALLVNVISRLTHKDPVSRGSSLAELAAELGPSTESVRLKLAEYLVKLRPWATSSTAKRHPSQLVATVVPRIVPLAKGPLVFQWPTALKGYLPAAPRRTAGLALAGSVLLMVALGTWLLWPKTPGSSDSTAVATTNQSATPAAAPSLLTPEQLADAKPLNQSGSPSLPIQQGTGILPVSASSAPTEQVIKADHRGASSRQDASAMRASSSSKPFLPLREIVLPSDRIIAANSLELQAGIRLAPAAGQRARIQVPPNGWRMDVEDVRVENVDFIPSPPSGSDATSVAVLIELCAAKAQFHGCSFQAAHESEQSEARVTAIRWLGADQKASLDRLPPAGHLLLANCFLSKIQTGIDCSYRGPVILELDNSLFTAPNDAAQAGPLWKIANSPASEDSIILRMNACTLRDAMSLVDIYCTESPTDPGKIKIETDDCIFAPRSTGALLRLIGPFRPDRLLHNIAWQGRGSLLPIQGRFALWYDAQGSPHAVDDSKIEIDGLVRGGVEFAGDGHGSPQASALIHWAAPLIGDARPGVRVTALPAGLHRGEAH